MAITLPTEAEVLALAVAYFQVAHRDPITGLTPPMGPRSFLGQQARALAGLIGEVLGYAKAIDDDSVPGGIYVDAAGVTRTRNSSALLDDWATTLALPSDVAGKYGRKGATVAKNGGATATGSPGVIVPTAAQLTDTSGQVTLKLRTGFTMPGGGSQAVVLDALTKGASGRLSAGTVLRWSSAPPGLVTSLTLTTSLSGGGDSESDVELALRIVARMQNRPRGGSSFDYREWTEYAEDGNGSLVGVSRAYVYPNRDGAGSVTVVPCFGGSGQARDPGAGATTQIQTWLDSLRIATDTVYVVRPRFVAGEELTINAFVTPTPSAPFEWRDTSTVTAVSGTGTSLVVDALPASLSSAVDNGNKPRLAINLASPIPFVTRVTAYVVDTPMAGQHTLTLETALPSSPASKRVHPAGAATIPVASAILAVVDALGPSRSSGMAASQDRWQDTVSVAALAAATLSAVDSTTGARVVVATPSVGTGVGITINVGVASPTAADFPTYDNVPAQGPQLAEVAAIIVREAA